LDEMLSAEAVRLAGPEGEEAEAFVLFTAKAGMLQLGRVREEAKAFVLFTAKAGMLQLGRV
jgi:hypothetical protein